MTIPICTTQTHIPLNNPEDQIEDNGFKLSSVLQFRMERYLKFMKAIGLYSGDLKVNSGIRSDKKAHGFCVQFVILVNPSDYNSKKAERYIRWKDDIKENLIKMYKGEYKRVDGTNFLDNAGNVIDNDGTIWAKKEHFTEKDGVVTLDWESVKTHVNGLDLGRPNKTSPAASGYKDAIPRLPLPEKGPGITDHKQGGAIDIPYQNFLRQKDAINDLIALQFGLIRDGSNKETWHFELTGLAQSDQEKKIVEKLKR
jgi:hypothetical protein